MNVKIAKCIRVRCFYCGKVVRSNGKGELIYPHNRRVTDEVKAYMKLYTIGADSSKVIKMQRKAPRLKAWGVSAQLPAAGAVLEVKFPEADVRKQRCETNE